MVRPAVEERHLLEPPVDRLEVELGGLEDRRVGPERDRWSRCGRSPRPSPAAPGLELWYVLPPDEAVLVDLHVHPGGQRVDHRDADAVQTAGDRVRLAVELAAGVQHGQRDLDAGLLQLRVQVDRDAAAVVDDPHPAVGQQHDVDGVAVAGQRLVDGVVDDLPDQVVQAALAGGADVHAGPLADRLQALEHGDRLGAVLLLLLRCHPRSLSRTGRTARGTPGRRRTRGHRADGARRDRRPRRAGDRDATSVPTRGRRAPRVDVGSVARSRRSCASILLCRADRSSHAAPPDGA